MLSQDRVEDFDEDGPVDIDMDEVTNLSSSAIGISIMDQISGEIELTKNPTDFLGTVDERIRYLLELYPGSESLGIRGAEMRFYTEVASKLAVHVGATTDGFDLEPTVPAMYKRKIAALYRFFIIHRFRNTLGLYYAYIMNHRKELAKELKALSDKKDLTVSNMRKNLKNFDDVAIIYNISDIIDDLAKGDMKMDEFIDLLVVSDGDSVDTYLAIDCLKGCSLPKPFETYVEPVIGDDNLRASLETELLYSLNSSFERK